MINKSFRCLTSVLNHITICILKAYYFFPQKLVCRAGFAFFPEKMHSLYVHLHQNVTLALIVSVPCLRCFGESTSHHSNAIIIVEYLTEDLSQPIAFLQSLKSPFCLLCELKMLLLGDISFPAGLSNEYSRDLTCLIVIQNQSLVFNQLKCQMAEGQKSVSLPFFFSQSYNLQYYNSSFIYIYILEFKLRYMYKFQYFEICYFCP